MSWECISAFVLAVRQVAAIDCNKEEVFLYLKSILCLGEIRQNYKDKESASTLAQRSLDLKKMNSLILLILLKSGSNIAKKTHHIKKHMDWEDKCKDSGINS